ncbi:patched protein [Plakobranchus ocellatus]|uniref:Patched protein n=1 Tax=Plakobranchus ocellatus TaxID=259542 RepID=A0AAV3YLB7_9GAST|nr:patched protein [Plakobranchus ocellatus]
MGEHHSSSGTVKEFPYAKVKPMARRPCLEANERALAEGGRLERELGYVRRTVGEGSRTAFELLIQTPREGGPSLLTVDSVQLHYRTLLAATRIEVHVGGISWSFRDLCYAVDFPTTETTIDLILQRILPCVIITPVDCFWEGSRLLGPEYPVATGFVYKQYPCNNLQPSTGFVEKHYPCKYPQGLSTNNIRATTCNHPQACLETLSVQISTGFVCKQYPRNNLQPATIHRVV